MADGKEWTTANLNVNVSPSYCYDDAEANCRRYGRLYTWESAQGVCQSLGDGWRLPTDDEWRQMAKRYGGVSSDSADKGKAAFTALLSGGTSGFNAVLGGNRSDGQYARLEAHGFYWTASDNDPGSAPFYNFGKGGQALHRQPQGEKQMAISVRCVRGDRSVGCWSGGLIMTSFNPNYFIHAANVLLLVAYSVRDILWLRLFAVAASLISLPYFVLQATPQWPPIAWSVVFAGINSFQSWRLYLERRPVTLTPDEEEVRRLAFAQLPSRKVLQLVSLGTWTTAAPGERLIEHGTPAEAIALVVRGNVRVSKDGRVLGELGAGDIVGSALALSGAPAEVDAVTVEPLRALRWEVATLRRYLEADPETRIVFQRNLTQDLAGKLRRLGEDYLRQPPSQGR